MIPILLQLLVLRLQRLHLAHVLLLNDEGVALVLISRLSTSAAEEGPISVDCSDKVLLDYLQNNPLLLALLPSQLDHFPQGGKDQLLLFVCQLPRFCFLVVPEGGYGVGEPFEDGGVAIPFLAGVNEFMTPGYFEECLYDVVELSLGEF